MGNERLGAAKRSKNDEFFTQYVDIEKEINSYLEYNPDVFRGKTVLLPCDDPEWSNFTKYFAQNFETFGLKKLMSTSYAPNSKPKEISYQPTLFELNSVEFDAEKDVSNGKIFVLEEDRTGNGVVNVEDLEWSYLEGDGDFRSEEIKALRDQADVIVTNPPFSLFREFLRWIVEADKEFLIIGNMNALTYKEVFPLLKSNKVWLGNNYKVNGGAMFYEIPESIANMDQVREVRTDEKGKKVFITRVQGVRWFTNLDHGRRHKPLSLMTMADNMKFGRVVQNGYDKYDNFDAIEVPRVEAIPSDYKGVMGVPVSFFDKYSPDQFEILGNTEGFEETPPTKTYSKKQRVVNGVRAKSNTGTMSGVIRREDFGEGTFFDVGYPVQAVYKRIFIRHRELTE